MKGGGGRRGGEGVEGLLEEVWGMNRKGCVEEKEREGEEVEGEEEGERLKESCCSFGIFFFFFSYCFSPLYSPFPFR